MGKTKEFNPWHDPSEVLLILIRDIKDADNAEWRQLSVQNYKIFCEAELTRAKADECRRWLEHKS